MLSFILYTNLICRNFPAGIPHKQGITHQVSGAEAHHSLTYLKHLSRFGGTRHGCTLICPKNSPQQHADCKRQHSKDDSDCFLFHNKVNSDILLYITFFS